MNRRGFIGALTAVLALFRPRPLCVACGSRDHVTSLCPINNAAMGPGDPNCSNEALYETPDGRRIFYEIDATGKMTGLLVSYPASAFDKTTGQFDVSRKIVWPS